VGTYETLLMHGQVTFFSCIAEALFLTSSFASLVLALQIAFFLCCAPLVWRLLKPDWFEA